MAKFTASEARKLSEAAMPAQMEESDEYFAGILRDIEQTARNGDTSLILVEPMDELTIPHVIELYSRGFDLLMVDALGGGTDGDVMICWGAE